MKINAKKFAEKKNIRTFAIPFQGTHTAEIAQLVEHNLAKVGVASSSLVFRSKLDAAKHPIFLRKQNGKLFSLSRYQIPQCLKGMTQNHSWSAIAHYFANPGSHFRSVTMHSAFMTFGLLLTEPAMLKSCK